MGSIRKKTQKKTRKRELMANLDATIQDAGHSGYPGSLDIPDIYCTPYPNLLVNEYSCNAHLMKAWWQPGDDIGRLEFCNWFKEKINSDRHFLKFIIFSGETQFSNDGMYDCTNHTFLSRQNPLQINEERCLETFSIKCWVALVYNRVLMFKIYDGQSDRYIEILEDLVEIIRGMPQDCIDNMYFQQDEGSAYNSKIIKDFLNDHFQDNWIGTVGPVKWPARSADITPITYFLWGYVKREIYKSNYDSVEDLSTALENIIKQMDPNEIRNEVLHSLPKRLDLCPADFVFDNCISGVRFASIYRSTWTIYCKVYRERVSFFYLLKENHHHKMQNLCVFILVVLTSAVYSLPVDKSEISMKTETQHNLQKRFINPLFSLGAAETEGLVKLRTKRSEEDCEKLELCKLHARANRNFFSAFQLYFVNKENARLWDHHAHSAADCDERYSCY